MEAALFNADGGAAATTETSNSLTVAQVNNIFGENRTKC